MPAKRGSSTRSPVKKDVQENSQKSRKLDFQADSMASGSTTEQNSSPMKVSYASKLTADESTAPIWFSRYEERLDARFEVLAKDFKDMQDGLNHHIKDTEEKFETVNDEMKSLWDKIDDLENRSRRNNLVLYNVPEKTETNPSECIDFMKKLSKDFIKIKEGDIPVFQRAHRTPTGPPRAQQNKPRPIHIQFASFQDKIAFRKSAVALFKTTTFNGWKLFIQDDLSVRIQKNRKELVPTLKKLREEGKRPFFVYPAILKYWDNDQLKVYAV